MRKRLIEAGIGMLGLVVIALAVASATLWRADDVLVARGTATSGLVVTDPGVLELGGDPVTVRAHVPAGARVVLAVGRDTDVSGWVGTDRYQRMSGLSGWRSLRLAAPATAPAATATASSSAAASDAAGSTSTSAPAAAEASATPGATASATPGTAATPAADPTGSDMWVAQAAGTGSAQLVWHAQDGRWSLLVAGIAADGSAVAPTLEMSWPRVVSAPWLVPGLVLGGLLLIAGAGLLGRDWWRARTGHDGWTSVETGALPQVVPAGPAPVLTRRQLRELQSRSGRPPTAAIQAVAEPEAHRVAETAATAAPTSAGPQTGSSRASGPRTSPAAAAPTQVFPGLSPESLTAAEAARRAAAARPAPGPVAAGPDAPTPSRTGASPTSWRPTAKVTPEPEAAAEHAGPPWAQGSRRARREAPVPPRQEPQGPGPAPAAPGGSVLPAHEGRPAWAAPPATGVRPDSAPPAAASTTPPRTRQSSTPQATSARAPQPPRPGGWVPVPGDVADSSDGPHRRAERAAPPGQAESGGSPTASRPVHPSWLTGQPPVRPGESAAPATAGRTTPAEPQSDAAQTSGEDEPDETPSSRADAWRRAWGLPTEPPADERGGEGR